MSGQNETLDVGQAYQHVYAEVHAPAFFEKLAADFNIVPQTDAQAQQLLEMGEKLFNAQQAEQTKVAAANGDFLTAANQQLDHALAAQGLTTEDPVADRAIKTAAAALVKDDSVREAALVFQNALLANAMGQQSAA